MFQKGNKIYAKTELRCQECDCPIPVDTKGFVTDLMEIEPTPGLISVRFLFKTDSSYYHWTHECWVKPNQIRRVVR